MYNDTDDNDDDINGDGGIGNYGDDDYDDGGDDDDGDGENIYLWLGWQARRPTSLLLNFILPPPTTAWKILG